MTAACGHRECADPGRERVFTSATVVTLSRTVAALVLAMAAAQRHSLPLLVGSLVVYWVFDIADGALARWRDEETRIGAVLDVLCDRLSAACFYLGYAWYATSLVVPVGVYLAEFMVVDLFLSLAFLAWPIASPNYFYAVDRTLWRWNWSAPAKAVNGGLFAILLIVTQNAWLCGAWAGALLVFKAVSSYRLSRLRLPVPGGCAVQRPQPVPAP